MDHILVRFLVTFLVTFLFVAFCRHIFQLFVFAFPSTLFFTITLQSAFPDTKVSHFCLRSDGQLHFSSHFFHIFFTFFHIFFTFLRGKQRARAPQPQASPGPPGPPRPPRPPQAPSMALRHVAIKSNSNLRFTKDSEGILKDCRF